MKKLIFIIFITLLMPVSKAFAVGISAQSACVMEISNDEIVFEKDAYKKLPMASTTKIMTAIIALEMSDIDEIVTVSRNAAYQEGSSAYLYEGFKITMRDALYALMLNSGNDAAVAIAEHISGGCDEFSELMNKKAESLGLENTHFKNPNGLHNEEHYTTAYELAKLASYAMKNDEFEEIVSAKSYTFNVLNTNDKREYFNHNKLLRLYDGCIGIKTGFTRDAGRCLVSCARRGDIAFVSVTLNDKNDWNDHIKMLDDAFSQYETNTIVRKGESVRIADADLIYENDFRVTKRKGDNKQVRTELYIPDKIPVSDKNERIGVAAFLENGKEIGRVYVLTKNAVYEETNVKSEIILRFYRILNRVLI